MPHFLFGTPFSHRAVLWGAPEHPISERLKTGWENRGEKRPDRRTGQESPKFAPRYSAPSKDPPQAFQARPCPNALTRRRFWPAYETAIRDMGSSRSVDSVVPRASIHKVVEMGLRILQISAESPVVVAHPRIRGAGHGGGGVGGMAARSEKVT